MSIETSPEIAALLEALSQAQGKMEPALKSAVNPAFKRAGSNGSKYADLAGCMKAIKTVLSEHGLSLVQIYAGRELVTMLGHKSGQFIRGSVPIPHFDELTPQQIGSATTYLRRYSLGIVGLVTEEDDDGNEASGHGDAPIPKGTTTDPRGEDWKKVDTKLVNKYVSLLMDAIDNDRHDAVKELSDELSQEPNTKIAVWHVLQKPMKDKIRDILDQRKAA